MKELVKYYLLVLPFLKPSNLEKSYGPNFKLLLHIFHLDNSFLCENFDINKDYILVI